MPAFSQPTFAAQMQRYSAIDPAKATPADCDSGVGKAEALNAFDLFAAALTCLAAKKPVEGDFLFAAGQTRAMADMMLMKPATESDMEPASSLYGLIFYRFGGPGDDTILRDSQATARMLAMFDAWNPRLAVDYDPGWKASQRPDLAAYQSSIDMNRSHRRKQLVAIARAYSDPEYYSAQKQFEKLQGRTGAFVEGTPESAEADRLQRLMPDRAKALGIDFGGD